MDARVVMELYREAVGNNAPSLIAALAWAVFVAGVLSFSEGVQLDHEGKFHLLNAERAERLYGKLWQINNKAH